MRGDLTVLRATIANAAGGTLLTADNREARSQVRLRYTWTMAVHTWHFAKKPVANGAGGAKGANYG